MCGLFAAFSLTGERPMDYSAQLDLLAHRGPDDQGVARWSRRTGLSTSSKSQSDPTEAWLGHKRLSIIDLAQHGRQPMLSPDARYGLVFNGEIYNYLELRQELSAVGVSFQTQTDSEVLLQAWIRWGRKGLTKLKGMFSFIIMDFQNARAVAVRDYFGIKPLFYALHDGQIFFSSELWPILELENFDNQLNATALFQYLRFGTSGSSGNTLVNHINSVPAAHLIEIDIANGRISDPQLYWRPSDETHQISFKDAVAQTRERFLENIRLHLRSDVPVGAALSGGIDSSAIVCAMRHLEPDLELNTFSYISDDPRYSEERWVDIVTNHVGANSHKIRPNPHDLANDIENLVRVQGAPFGSTSIYAQYCVFRAAKEQGVVVMLDGQGADELLGGYDYFIGSRIAELLRQGHIATALKLFQNSAVENPISKASLAQNTARYLLPGSNRAWARKLVGRDLVPGAIESQWFKSNGVEISNAALQIEGAPVSLREHLWQTVSKSSLPHLLRYEDRNSMAFSIESRVPFLTHDFADFVLNLPPEFQISPMGRRKHVLREAMKGIVPEEILTRRDKIGFRSTESEWLRASADYVSDVFDQAGDHPFFSKTATRKMVDDLQAGRPFNSSLMWRIFNFLLWSRQLPTQNSR